MRNWLLLFWVLPIHIFAQSNEAMDSTLSISYNFHLSNKKIIVELASYSVSYVNKDSNLWITNHYDPDSIIRSKKITYKNKLHQDSVRYSLIMPNNIDSCKWSYDSNGREIKYTLFKNDGENGTLNWYSEYQDSIFDNIRITKQVRYRVDLADNYLDTCCIEYSIKTYKNELLIENKVYGEYGDTIKTEYHYDKSGNLENTTVMTYNSFDGVLINLPNSSNGKCLKVLDVDFPAFVQPWTSKQIEKFLSEYLNDFYDLDCKPQRLVLESKKENSSITIVRAACHIVNAGTINFRINY